jgi:uncharacterized protein (TIGR02001 family)
MRSLPRARRALAVLCCLAAPAAAAAGWGGTVGASSDSVFRGISESDGDPAAQASLHHVWESGVIAGARAATIKPRSAAGSQTEVELDAFLGLEFTPTAAWSGRLLLNHYDQLTGTAAAHPYDELAASATWLGRVSLLATASQNKWAAGRRGAAYGYEATLRWPVSGELSLDAGVGHYDLRRLVGTGYTYWSAGATYWHAHLGMSVAWVGTDDRARDRYRTLAEDRIVASVLWTY